MIFIWGERLSGRIDQVPGLCYVATLFFHIFFFPLVPFGTYIVVDGTVQRTESKAVLLGWTTKHGFQGLQIPMNWKSVFFGWMRGLFVFLALNALMGVIAFTQNVVENHNPKAW